MHSLVLKFSKAKVDVRSVLKCVFVHINVFAALPLRSMT